MGIKTKGKVTNLRKELAGRKLRPGEGEPKLIERGRKGTKERKERK
jgi:hypothetical protein